MTEALLTAVARQLVHIAGPKHNRDAPDRQRGFVDAMTKIAKERNPVILPGDFSEESGEKAARLFVEGQLRSEEHTSELQSLMRISYAVFCLKKKKKIKRKTNIIRRSIRQEKGYHII